MSKKEGSTQKLNYGRTILIGFGFMACMLLWSVYNSYVPVILRGKFTMLFDGSLGETLSSTAALKWISVPLLVNAVMTIDNIFGVIFQPFFGKKSDSTKSKYGKRMPYIIIGLPICALFFCFIPVAAATKAVGLSVLLMMSVIICFNFVMSVWRSPVVSLMPDFTPSNLQSDANAVINIMGGVGQIFGFVIGTVVSAVAGILGFAAMSSSISAKTDEATGRILDEAGNVTDAFPDYTPIFAVAAVISVLCLIVLVAFYKKNSKHDLSASVELEKDGSKPKKIKIRDLPITKGEKKSLLIMLAALFFINNATEAIIPNFTNFAQKTLKVEPIYSTLMMAVFAVSLALFGIPAGMLGRKLGRKKTIIGGLISVITIFGLYLGLSLVFGNTSTITTVAFWVAIVIGGAGIGAVNINTLPLVLAIGGREFVGTFTGYYYTATFSAAVTGPIFCGLVIGLFNENYNFMFLFCAVAMLLGLLAITFVKHGEAIPQDIIDEAERNAN